MQAGQGRTAIRRSAASSSSMGCAPGSISAMKGSSGPSKAPCLIAGTSPARTTEDFPPPLGPTTARNLDPGPASLILVTSRRVSCPPPEEVVGIGLGERPEALVGVPLLGASRRSSRRGFEGHAGRYGERIRIGCTRPVLSALGELARTRTRSAASARRSGRAPGHPPRGRAAGRP